jgi:zinc protease
MSKVLRPEELQLSNGMPVILQNYDGPVASIYWWVKTGSADERPNEAGFAHFLEHMHFKDTDAKNSGQASTGEVARAIESLGGDVNAYTSFDQTVYHVTCAAHHWEKVIEVFGAISKPQRFLKEDFIREREVILEELKKNEDSPSRQLFQTLFNATYSKHPYGRPVIGFVKTLKDAKVKDLEAFYQRQYVSGNMGLVLVGPFTEERKKKIMGLAEKFYGAKVIKKKPEVHAPRAVEPEYRSAPKLLKTPFAVTTPSLCIAFRVPSILDSDIPALDLAAGILGMGEMSRLYQNLFYGKSIATDINAGLYVPKDPGMIYVSAEADKMEKLAPLLEGILDEMIRLRDEGPTEDEILRVVTNSESERYYATQTADGIAGRLGYLKYQLGDLGYDQRYIEELKSLNASHVRAILDQYMDPKRMSLALMVPKKEKDFSLAPLQAIIDKKLNKKSKSTSIDSQKSAAKKSSTQKSSRTTPSEPTPELITLDSGVRVLYRERSGSHLASIHAASLGGLRLEQADPVTTADMDLGASQLLAMTWTKGTKHRTAHQITSLIEGSAANLDGFSGRNTIGLQSLGLARDWPKISTLFNEILLEPTFPEAELEHSRRVVEESIKSIEDHSSALCSKLFLQTLFENHPYGKHSSGTLESVKSIDSARLKAFHQKWIQPERLVISVVGNVWRKSLDLWLKDLDDKFKQHKKIQSLDGLASVGEEAILKGPRWVEKNLKREQVHIVTGGLGLHFKDEDRRAMKLLQTLLGGQSGRLFIELREKKSLAYSVAPLNVEGIERGYVGTYIACSPSKKDEAIQGIKAVLEQLANKGPTASEMKRAKEYYLGRRAMDLQGDSAWSSYYTLEKVYELPFRTEAEIVEKIEAVTAKEVQDVCRKYYIDPHHVTSIVG